MKEIHDKTCGSCGKVSLYCRLQRAGFYWPSMGKDANQVQTQCRTCQLSADKKKSYVVFINEDWRSPFMQYLIEGVLPQRHSERYKLKRLATRYFLHNTVLFKKGYDGDLLRCLSLGERNDKEVHSGECGEHQGKKKFYRCLLQMGYYWPTMKRDNRICEKMPQLPSTSQPNSHSPAEFA